MCAKMRSLTYLSCFCMKFFFYPICAIYANWAYFDIKNHIKIFFSETIDTNEAKLNWGDNWVVHVQKL